MTSTQVGRLFSEPYNKPLSTAGAPQALCTRQFFVSGTAFVTQAPVYQDAALTTPYAQPIASDANGRFSPIYLNPALTYAVQLKSAGGATLAQADPTNVQNVVNPVSLFKAAGTARSNTIVLANDPDLLYTIPGAGTYIYEMDMGFTAAAAGATPGLQLKLNYTGTLNAAAGSTAAINGFLNGAAPAAAASSTLINTALTGLSLGLTPDTNTIRITGTIQVTTGGVLSFQWAQAVSSASAVTLLAGAAMTLTQIG